MSAQRHPAAGHLQCAPVRVEWDGGKLVETVSRLVAAVDRDGVAILLNAVPVEVAISPPSLAVEECMESAYRSHRHAESRIRHRAIERPPPLTRQNQIHRHSHLARQ